MANSVTGAGKKQTLQALIELVEALERRVPRPNAGAEQQIAADSAELHAQATESIQEMRRECRSLADAEIRRAHSVMTDDGGPVSGCADSSEVA
jgi:hypothetical protein